MTLVTLITLITLVVTIDLTNLRKIGTPITLITHNFKQDEAMIALLQSIFNNAHLVKVEWAPL